MTDPIRLRQICLIVPELYAATDEVIDRLGLKVCYGKADLSRYGIPYTPPPPQQAAFFEKHGLASVQHPIGDTFLELVAPLKPGTPAARFVETRGPGGYMVITEVGDTAPVAARIEATGTRLASTVDYPGLYHELQIDPRDCGASMLSFSMQREGSPFDGGWYPAGRNWKDFRVDGDRAIRAAELSVADPAAVADRWARLIGRPAEPRGETMVIELDDSSIRFVPRCEGKDRLTAAYVDTDRFGVLLGDAREAGYETDGGILIHGLALRDAAELS